MKNKLERYISILLSFALIITFLPVVAINSHAATSKSLVAYYDFNSSSVPSNKVVGGPSVSLVRTTNGASLGYGTNTSLPSTDDRTYQSWSNASAPGYQYKMTIGKNISSNYSMALKFSFTQTRPSDGGSGSNWRKIIDYKNFGADAGFYFNQGYLQFYSDKLDNTTLIYPNNVVDLIITRNGVNNLFTVYLVKYASNGTSTLREIFSFTDSSGKTNAYSTGSNTVFGFFSDDGGSEFSQGGKVYNIKVWDYCMTPEEAAVASQPISVSYNGNGVSLTESVYTAKSYEPGSAVYVAAKPSTNRAGCSFAGWKANDGTIYQPGQSFGIQSAVTLTAQWKPNAPTIASTQGYSGDYDGSTHYLYANPNQVSGLTYRYQWYKKNGSSSTAVSGATTSACPVSRASDTGTYYCAVTAICGNYSTTTNSADISATINSKVIFDSQGGSSVNSINSVPYNTTITLLTTPTKTGYWFNGWYTGTNGTGTALLDSTKITQNTTYYAKWVANSYYVRFNQNADSVTGTMPNQEFTYDASKNLTNILFSKIGYHFTKWTTDIAGEETAYNNSQSVKNLSPDYNGLVDLYAQWAPNTNTAYKIKHYKQQLNGIYKDVADDIDNLTGTTDTSVAASVKNYTGFTSPTSESISILPDGTTEKVYRYTRNKYALEWLTSGDELTGDYTEGQTLFETPIIQPDIPTKTGYTFVSWNLAVPNKMPSEQVTYTALFNPNTYKVTFDNNDGSMNSTNKNVTYDSVFGTLPILTRTGYTFDGWYDSAVGGNKVTSSTYVKITENEKLYAHWIANKYVITFDNNDGLTNTFTKDVFFGSALPLVSMPTWAGYAFCGYYMANSSGTDNMYYNSLGIAVKDAYAVANNISLKACWIDGTYPVENILANCTTNNALDEATHGNSYNAILIADDGYNFYPLEPVVINIDGLASIEVPIAEITDTVNISIPGDKIIGDITINANTEKTIHEITYITNGGNFNAAVPNKFIELVGLTSLKIPVKDGYIFSGWYDNENLSGLTVNSIEANTKDDVTLYAKWTPRNDINYTVNHFKQNLDGITYPTNASITRNFTGTTDTTVTAPVEDYIGFATPHAGTIAIAPDGTAVKNYYYTRNKYMMEWFTSGNPLTGSYTSGETFYETLIVTPDTPTKTGYTFANWSPSVLDKMPANNVNYTAVFTPNAYKVTFDRNDGSMCSTQNSVTYDSIYGTLPILARTGYTFEGWYTSLIGGTKIEHDTKVSITSNQTLYAHWIANKYVVTFDNRDGLTPTFTKDVFFDSELPLVPLPTWAGYVFCGYYMTAPNSLAEMYYNALGMSQKDAYAVADSITLNASWIDATYELENNFTNCSAEFTPSELIHGTDYSITLIANDGYTFNPQQPITVNITGGKTLELVPEKISDTYVVNIPGNAIIGKVTINATAVKTIHSITYETNGGIVDPKADAEFVELEGLKSIMAPTRDGYIFKGWYDNDELTGNPVSKINANTKNDINLYAFFVPVGITETKVEATLETPPVVEGLTTKEQFIPASAADKGFTEEELKKISIDGASLKLALEVKEMDKTAITSESSKGLISISDSVNEAGCDLKYVLDMTVDKYIREAGSTEYTRIGSVIELPSVIAVTVKVPDGIDINKVAVWRNHEGEVTKLEQLETATGEDGTFTVNASTREVTIYTKYFSIYAIGQEKEKIREVIANTSDDKIIGVFVMMVTVSVAGTYLTIKRRREI